MRFSSSFVLIAYLGFAAAAAIPSPSISPSGALGQITGEVPTLPNLAQRGKPGNQKPPPGFNGTTTPSQSEGGKDNQKGGSVLGNLPRGSSGITDPLDGVLGNNGKGGPSGSKGGDSTKNPSDPSKSSKSRRGGSGNKGSILDGLDGLGGSGGKSDGGKSGGNSGGKSDGSHKEKPAPSSVPLPSSSTPLPSSAPVKPSGSAA
ncbi:hypothetical protein F5I97DRAFT_1161268 [Phlebopus sp. FC_14]|nr:hypothetical protein F5I97DRAFT_1161268 [Phlebopus sp. FC_14]